MTLHGDQQNREEAIKSRAVSLVTKDRLINELPDCLDSLADQGHA